MSDIIERCQTGIKGFDALCQGGFVRNSVNVLVGGPGSGKSTFLMQFLFNGATKFNENGLYCSFEPDIVETLKDAQSFGWDLAKLDQENKVKFMKFSPHTSIEDLKSELLKTISTYNIRRICFDPVSVLTLNSDNQGKIREIIFDIASLMKRLRVTTLLADETIQSTNLYSEKSTWSETDILKFLADGIILFYEAGISGISDRAIQISKMRRTLHIRNPVGMRIDTNGINVVPAG